MPMKGNIQTHEIKLNLLYRSRTRRKVFPLFRVIETNEAVALDAQIEAVYVPNAGHILAHAVLL
jgi:metallo-beta-lactamase family protein